MSVKEAGHYRALFGDASTSRTLTTASTTVSDLIAVKDAYHTIYVQRITVKVTTSAAQNWTFQDDATTPIVLAVLPNSASVAQHDFDFGAQGFACTEAKNLDLVVSSAGVAGSVTVEAYQKLTAVTSD